MSTHYHHPSVLLPSCNFHNNFFKWMKWKRWDQRDANKSFFQDCFILWIFHWRILLACSTDNSSKSRNPQRSKEALQTIANMHVLLSLWRTLPQQKDTQKKKNNIKRKLIITMADVKPKQNINLFDLGFRTLWNPTKPSGKQNRIPSFYAASSLQC